MQILTAVTVFASLSECHWTTKSLKNVIGDETRLAAPWKQFQLYRNISFEHEFIAPVSVWDNCSSRANVSNSSLSPTGCGH